MSKKKASSRKKKVKRDMNTADIQDQDLDQIANGNVKPPTSVEVSADLDEAQDNFGNQKDYVPEGGLGGIYREPMQGGASWGFHGQNKKGRNHRNRRHQRHVQQHEEQEGVLSIRQPGWKDQVDASETHHEQAQSGVLTIRQQGTLARSLRWQNGVQQPEISRHGGNNNNNNNTKRQGKQGGGGKHQQQQNNKNRKRRPKRNNQRGKR